MKCPRSALYFACKRHPIHIPNVNNMSKIIEQQQKIRCCCLQHSITSKQGPFSTYASYIFDPNAIDINY